MTILQLCSKVPFPPVDGGTIAMHSLTEGLIKLGAEVKVLAISTHKHPFRAADISADYKNKTQIEAFEIDTRIKPFSAFLNLFVKSSYNISRFYSRKFEDELVRVLKDRDFDIIQLETVFVSPYLETIRKHCKAKIILRMHNVEYKIWEKRAKNNSNPLLKWYLGLLASRLKSHETRLINSYDGIAAITPEDAMEVKNMGCVKPVSIVPFGLDLQLFQDVPEIPKELQSCFHLGTMNWAPNCEGVKWLMNEVWHKVTERQPAVKLYLAGRFMPGWLKNLKRPGIEIVGEVKSQFDFMQKKGIMLVPLLSGGGMRIKIIEGMAMGKTIVSTSLGAEGIPWEHKKNILIADTAEAFANCILTCINDAALCQKVGKNARELISTQFDNVKICRELLLFYRQILLS